jgi:hypothetical protein
MKYDCDTTFAAVNKTTTSGAEYDEASESGEEQETQIKTIKDINDFFNNFLELCQAASDIVEQARVNLLAANLFLLSTDLNWDYLLLAVWVKNKPQNTDNLLKLLKLLELACMQIMLVKLDSKKTRKDFLWTMAYEFYHNRLVMDDLLKNLRNFIKKGEYPNNSSEWPCLADLIDAYKEDRYHYRFYEVTKYILYQYENSLRKEKLFDKKLYGKFTIEHILARNSEDKENTETFQARCMDCIGNLALLSARDNPSLGKSSFAEKKEKYKELEKNELVLYREITAKAQWRQTEVNERKEKIYGFIDRYFI